MLASAFFGSMLSACWYHLIASDSARRRSRCCQAAPPRRRSSDRCSGSSSAAGRAPRRAPWPAGRNWTGAALAAELPATSVTGAMARAGCCWVAMIQPRMMPKHIPAIVYTMDSAFIRMKHDLSSRQASAGTTRPDVPPRSGSAVSSGTPWDAASPRRVSRGPGASLVRSRAERSA